MTRTATIVLAAALALGHAAAACAAGPTDTRPPQQQRANEDGARQAPAPQAPQAGAAAEAGEPQYYVVSAQTMAQLAALVQRMSEVIESQAAEIERLKTKSGCS